MQSKFRFSLDGVDATARQFAEVRRQLRELLASVDGHAGRLGSRVAAVERGVASLESRMGSADPDGSGMVTVPAHGDAGVRNVFASPLSLASGRPVYCLPDGRLGVDCSSASSVAGVSDADGFIPLDAFRRVGWKVFFLKDDLNSRLDDAQPAVGFLAEDLDDAGLGFFCEYDDGGNAVGVDYPRLSVAALRLVQRVMDDVDELRGEVARLSSMVGRMGVSTSERIDREE